MQNKNVILLTSGLTGSSVLTGLISRGGYWTGETTFKKPDYNTYENTELIELNRALLREAGCPDNYQLEFSSEALARIGALHGKIDDVPYKRFVAKCDQHRPWIWKDPRLWMTIRFWYDLLDPSACKFILLTRGAFQGWISQTLRRQITTYRYSRYYESAIKNSVVSFFEQYHVQYVHIQYESLIEDPVEAVSTLNTYLNLRLTVDDLRHVYHKSLFKRPRPSLTNYLKAFLIYTKNYSQRIDLLKPEQ